MYTKYYQLLVPKMVHNATMEMSFEVVFIHKYYSTENKICFGSGK